MGLLEKLRPQPKWKHADPTIRLDGLHEIDDGDQATLTTLASDDPDPRVRRAALVRVANPDVLAACVRNDRDQAVRDHAAGRLAALAGQGEETSSLAAVAALAAIGCQRELATVARGSGSASVRRSATEQVTDERALAGIARHAADAGARLVAVTRLNDASELEGVAVRGEHADAAVAALDRLLPLPDDSLQSIGQRARTKAVQKRVRALLKAGHTESAPPATAGPTYLEADQARAADLTTQMEALAASADAKALRESFASLRVAWVELLADAEIQADHEGRFERASDRVRERVTAMDAARAAEARRAQALAQAQAERAALCDRVEQLDDDEALERLNESRATWEGMPPMPEEWAPALQQRFDAACHAAQRRYERRLSARQLADQAPELVARLDTIAAAPDYPEVRAEAHALRKQWQAMARDAELDPTLVARFEQAAQRLDAQEAEHREGRARAQQENLHRLRTTVQDLETRAASDSLTLRDAERMLKDAKLVIGTMGPLPSKQDRDDLTVRLQAVRSALTPRIKELREGEEWKRWANVTVQEELCAKMEALIAEAEAAPEKAATEMRLLQERWKAVAAAPRSQAEALWTRFKTAQGEVYEKCKDFFAQQAAERQENLKRKETLCVRAEALADSTDWIRTAEAIKQLQAEWKIIGPVSRGHEKSVWERFRAACDRFFSRRQEDLKARKHDWAENLAKKEALIVEAEQLAQSTEWEKAASRIKHLQVEWKKIGPVRKNKSEVVWQRFRAACDTFFERFKNRDTVLVAGKVADRETAVTELEALVLPSDAADTPVPVDLYARVQAARARYLQGPDLPRHTLAPLAERINSALLQLAHRWPEAFRGTELDPETTKRKMERLVEKIEGLVPPDAKESSAGLSPAELLARQWRDALAANTMGAAAARQAEEARHRAIEQEVRSAQAAWQRLGPLENDTRKPLQDRFDRACRRFFEQKRRHMART
ncbi:MAG: DUF349 domain-containing protein [Acidobacteriota bacterium]